MDYTKPFSSSFPYFAIVLTTNLPISLVDVKSHLRLDPNDATQDLELIRLIKAAAAYCEKYTRRTLLYTTFQTYRNFLTPTIELRRSPIRSLESYQYSVSGSFVDVDQALYYTTMEYFFSKIILKNDSSYPSDGDDILQKVKIEFIAGYAADDVGLYAVVPDLYLAILNHIAALYENRGDCDLASTSTSLPNTSKIIYDSHRILEIV